MDLAIERLSAVTPSVAVNVHHGRAMMEAHLASRVHLSIEEPEALGTAGALGALREWIGGRSVLVANGDTWHRADMASFVDGWDGERVRLLLADGASELRTTSRPAAALMPWSEVRGLEPRPSGLYEVSWARLAAEGRLDVVGYSGPFEACDTPARYLAANLAASGGRSVVGSGAVVEGSIERSVLWPGSVVYRGEVLRDAIRAGGITVLVR